MKDLTKVRLHYIDKLLNNVFTLANLVFKKKYETLDCFGFDDADTLDTVLGNYLDTSAEYDDIAGKYLSGTVYGFKGGVTAYTAARHEFVVSACMDADGFSTLLAGKILGDKLPSSAKTFIKIATMFFKFVHYQITVVVSD